MESVTSLGNLSVNSNEINENPTKKFFINGEIIETKYVRSYPEILCFYYSGDRKLCKAS